MNTNSNRVTELKVCCIVKRDDQILLIKEWSETKNNYFWNVIKGTFEGDVDKNLSDCAVREMREEAQVNAFPTKFLGVVSKNGFLTRVYFGFLCSLEDKKNSNGVDSKKIIPNEEIKEIKWFNLADLKLMEPDKFINNVAFHFIQNILNNTVYPLEMLKEEYLGAN